LTMTPEPRLVAALRRLKPGVSRNRRSSSGSAGRGISGTLTCLLVYMLTTDGVACSTASWYDNTCGADAAGGAAWLGSGARGGPLSQSGRKVATMNNMPRHTVTVWANSNHNRRIRLFRKGQSMNQVPTQQLYDWLDATLQPQRFKDYCPNGLQVEGKSSISHIITGVTATQALLEAAIAQNADAVLVHHGWFWKNEDPCIRGPKRTRLALALQHDLNVFAYHLPLDAHPVLGNNAQLGRVLGLEPDRDQDGNPIVCGPDGLVWLGRCNPPLSLEAFG